VTDLIQKYSQDIAVVWNLAAPLSVETANDPNVAKDVTVGGFERLINAMDKANMPESTRICFSDSIGSYGLSAPRKEATADWLVKNPEQDPGSDYGK
jgi:threonine 3-dehydrogenase